MSEKKGFFSGMFGGKKSDCCNMEIIEEKETVAQSNCDCGGACGTGASVSIKVLGQGCKNCVTLAENVQKAVEQLGISANIEKITDMAVIASFGIMSTPGLVVNNKVVSFGKVLKPQEIAQILQEQSK